jgi:hypothetical protein
MFANKKFGQVDFCQQKLAIHPLTNYLKPINFTFACEVELDLTIELEIDIITKIGYFN